MSYLFYVAPFDVKFREKFQRILPKKM
jgi:hypothetical protein